MSRVGRQQRQPGAAFQNNLVTGAVIGTGAYLLNYVLMFVFVTIDGVEQGEEGWKFVGNILYNAQFVPIEISSGGESITLNFVTGSSSSQFLEAGLSQTNVASTIPSFVYHLAPIVVLTVAGFVAAQQVTGRLDTQSAVAAGLAIVPGTLVTSIVGVLLFESSSSGLMAGTAGPQLVMGALLVGIVIPAIGGAIGGFLAQN